MSAIYLSAVCSEHGEPHPLSELGGEADQLTLPDSGLANYRVSDQEIWEMAAAVCARSLAGAAGPPDLLVYVSENDRTPADSLEKILRLLGLGTIGYLAVCGHGCGNLVPALRMAKDALHSGRHDRVLLVLADRASDQDRTMLSGLSILSDGAVSCLVTREPEQSASSHFRIGAMTTRTDIVPDSAAPEEPRLLSIIKLAVAGVVDIAAGADGELEDVEYLVFGNYRITSQRFLASAMGFPPERLLLGQVAELGHCFSADVLVTLDQNAASGHFETGDRILASATGTRSWSMMLVECVRLPGSNPLD
ncbi:MAG TPA: 3-oxoacyl-[acyl-carrier-protein] synthase III C-terminal domain-containing protein [Pseudonocardiaceae bacterium]|nr:3-oxoacyl-[acyl-carrier-protein] synthase III C-terminal domain-containing protein [Pseudonocardiaceae bacterium]